MTMQPPFAPDFRFLPPATLAPYTSLNMSRTAARLIAVFALFVLALAPLAASGLGASPKEPFASIDAQDDGHGDEDAAGAGERRDGLNSVVIWTLAGVGIFAVGLGAFYFFKRQVGGFPENPAWVAPITIMPSKDFPDEADHPDSASPAPAHRGH